MSDYSPEEYPELFASHYRFWDARDLPEGTEPVGFDSRARVVGQFDEEPGREVNARHVRFIGNPVKKNAEKTLHPRTHLIAYDVQPSTEPRWVRLWNQFDRTGLPQPQVWLLDGPRLFLVPAGKLELDTKWPALQYPELPGDPVSHFICYKVIGGPAIDRQLELTDQFNHTPRRKYTLTPRYFGVPVAKRRHPPIERKEAIHHPRVHLALYGLHNDTSDDAETSKISRITTRDQFTGRLLEVLRDSLLAVPSLKPKWGVGHSPEL